MKILAELWHQRLGHLGPHQLSGISKHAIGVPNVTLHPMHSCKSYSDSYICKTPAGAVVLVHSLLPASQFHLDFGFIHASSDGLASLKSPSELSRPIM